MWYDSFSSLKAIDGMEHLNTEEMSNMSMMFNDCRVLKSIDLSRFNTEKVTDMSAMFKDCNDLTVLDLSTFCTDKVVDMNNMFCHCSALTNIYVSDKKRDCLTNHICRKDSWIQETIGSRRCFCSCASA